VTVQRFPLYRSAVKKLVDMKPEPGYRITKKWLDKHLELNQGKTREDFKQYLMDYMHAVDQFKDELLREHCIAIKSIRGIGYEIISPSEQTNYAYQIGLQTILKGISKMVDTMTFVDKDKLTSDERQDNANGLAKAAMMVGMVKKTHRLKLK